jgi:DNA-binding response OmpR family regulator
MSKANVLIVEDLPDWQEILRHDLGFLGNISSASNYAEALQELHSKTFELAVIDIGLPQDGEDTTVDELNERGMHLLREFRASHNNSKCALIVLTARPNEDWTRYAFRDYSVYDFLRKSPYDEDVLIKTACKALRHGRLLRARAHALARYRLNITFDMKRLVSSEITGPRRARTTQVTDSPSLEMEDLARSADNLNLLILSGGPEVWRPAARLVGKQTFEKFAREQRVAGDLAVIRALPERRGDLWLQFTGPAVGLGVPFELLHDDEDHLCLSYVLTRRLLLDGSLTRKTEPFHEFMGELWDKGEPLRILIVGANTDGNIPTAEVEARDLYRMLADDLRCLGTETEITLLCGSDATYDNVRDELRKGYHIFHYAGHGRHDDRLPEVSGLILRDGPGHRTMTADNLNQFVSDTPLRLVYLSCCLGARSGSSAGYGAFHGTLHALTRADVPAVLGYRWTVADDSSLTMACSFYETLWRTLSPADALLKARLSIRESESGRDDETWASPILLLQTD